MKILSAALIPIARLMLRCQLSRFIPKFLKELYWKVVLSQPKHSVNGSTMSFHMTSGPTSRGVRARSHSVFNNTLREGMIFCDVGANIGIYSLLAARLVGPTGKVIAVEPEPANAALLRKNIALNQYKHVEVIEKAISERPGILELYLSNYAGSHSIFPIQQIRRSRQFV